MSFLPANSQAPFLPTSQVFPEEESQLLIVHTDVYASSAQAINIRQIGTYDKLEQINGQFFFNDTTPSKKRLAYRQTYSFGATAAGATTLVAHNISGVNSIVTFTHIYGTCITAVIDNRPIPYASVTAIGEQIEVLIDATNINISNGAAAPAITSGIIVLEYLKD